VNELKRYHRECFFPEWSEESLNIFLKLIRRKNGLSISIHCLEKIINYCFQYGRQMLKYLLKSVRKASFTSSGVFEFYAVEQEIKKICVRFSFEEFPVDLILVISADGTIITVFTANKGDKHDSLDLELYEKE
jgi:hypothetical protein